jgi:SAM-dependent methyltransferase
MRRRRASRGVMLRASSRDEGRPLTFCTQDWIAFASVSISDLTERNRAAQELFAPLAATYDRYAQPVQPRPRSSLALVSRLAFEARPEDTILDVATATAAVALELARRYGCRVVGVDQSAEMLAAGRARVRAAGLNDRVELGEARAEASPSTFCAAAIRRAWLARPPRVGWSDRGGSASPRSPSRARPPTRGARRRAAPA